MSITLKGLAVMTIATIVPHAARGETVQWNCTYSKMASPSGITTDNFSLQFALDTITVKAVIIGNQGMSDVDAVNGTGGITFQERLITGAVQTTTIARDGASVHSRHTIVLGKLTPSQYYGSCK